MWVEHFFRVIWPQWLGQLQLLCEHRCRMLKSFFFAQGLLHVGCTARVVIICSKKAVVLMCDIRACFNGPNLKCCPCCHSSDWLLLVVSMWILMVKLCTSLFHLLWNAVISVAQINIAPHWPLLIYCIFKIKTMQYNYREIQPELTETKIANLWLQELA